MFFRAKKSLGQHFLNSKYVLDQIISAAEIKKNEIILEIGPGTGVLTSELLKNGSMVIAIEKDKRAYDLLSVKFSEYISGGQLKLIEGDVLTINLYTYLSEKSSYSIVANIPYYITGAILEKFLEKELRPAKMVLLVQKEVADRIVAIDGKESVLSISVKVFGNPQIMAKVPRGAFTPSPEVDSAILMIKDISGKNFDEENVKVEKFFSILKAGFAHKRKYLIRNLESVFSSEKIRNVWTENKLDEKIRAEDLPHDLWIEIARKLA